MFGRSDTGKLQEMRRVDGAAAQDHLLMRVRFDGLAALAEGDADAAFAVEQQPGGEGFGLDAEIGAVACFLQEGLRSRSAPAALAGHLRVANALRLAAVEVLAELETGVLGRLDEFVGQRQDGAIVLDLQRTVLPAILRVRAL